MNTSVTLSKQVWTKKRTQSRHIVVYPGQDRNFTWMLKPAHLYNTAVELNRLLVTFPTTSGLQTSLYSHCQFPNK